jgi:hypothetical protein
MKRAHFLSLTLLLVLITNSVFAQINPISINGEKGTAQSDKLIPLKRGEIVSLELVQSISSDNVQIGDVIKLQVTKPVMVEGYTLIHRGAYGEAIVRDVQRAKGYGRGGRIVLEVANVETFDGHRIALKANSLLIVEGQNRKGLAWGMTAIGVVVAGGVGIATLGATGMLVGVPFVALGSMIRGREATIELGRMVSATIMETKEVGADPKSVNHIYTKD